MPIATAPTVSVLSVPAPQIGASAPMQRQSRPEAATTAATGVTGAAPPTQPHLLGDWGGVRTALEDRGITPAIQYIAMPVWNVKGGTRSDLSYAAQFTAGATFDLDRIAGIEGGSFQLLVTNRHGDNINADQKLELLQNPQAIWGAGQVWRLSQMFYRQVAGKVDAKIGRMSVGEDFGTAPCFFESLYFCGIVPGHVTPQYWYNPPVSVWGTRVRVNDRLGYTQVGVYELNPDNLQPDKGFNLSFSGARGVLVPVERGFTVKLGGDPKRLGTYKIGVWHDTSVSDDLVRDVAGGYAPISGRALAQARGRWGGYVVARQQIRPPDSEGRGALTVNGSAVLTDGRTNLIRSIVVTGVTWTGLLKSRPKDEIGLAFGRTRINNRLTRVEQIQFDAGLISRVPQKAEYAIEAAYAIAVAPGLSVRPNVQWYIHPGGRSDRGSVSLLGLGAFLAM